MQGGFLKSACALSLDLIWIRSCVNANGFGSDTDNFGPDLVQVSCKQGLKLHEESFLNYEAVTSAHVLRFFLLK